MLFYGVLVYFLFQYCIWMTLNLNSSYIIFCKNKHILLVKKEPFQNANKKIYESEVSKNLKLLFAALYKFIGQ